MPSKELTAKVKLNTKSAEVSLDRLFAKINKINKIANQSAELGIVKALAAGDKAAQRLARNAAKVKREEYETWWAAELANKEWREAHPLLSKIWTTQEQCQQATTKWSSQLNNVNSKLNSSKGIFSSIARTLKSLAATYLGIMGARAAIGTSDMITSAENRLNNLPGGNPKLTAEAMDKMYAASQRARTGYGSMMQNVSKTMTLAGDAFQGNIDNAIRFQEIMSKSYTIGGASAEEMSTSMYQLTQALGAGVLQGDELRSVREGAPLAYKAIEKFAQGVLNTEESLKDLASQGLITSDMVVAAIMNSEEQINKSFKNTNITFAQAFEQIKNTAIRAFQPVLQRLNDILNSDHGKKVISAIESSLVWIADKVMWLIDVISAGIEWVIDNWNWLKHVIVGVLIAIMAYQIIKTTLSIACAVMEFVAWAMANAEMLVTCIIIGMIIAAIMGLIYIFLLWRNAAISTLEAIAYALFVVAAYFIILGIMTGMYWMLVLGVVIAVIGLIVLHFAEACGYINIGIQAIVNAWYWCGNLILGVWNWVCAAISNGWNWIVNVALGAGNAIKAIATNIGIAFSNAWNGAMSSFWNFIADCLQGLNWLAKPLASIAKLFGKSFDYSSWTSGIRNKASGYTQKSYVSVGDAWNSGYNTKSYKDLGEAWSKGWNTYDVFQNGWASNAYDQGYAWGENIENKVNAWGSQFQKADGNSLFDKLSNVSGKLNTGIPNPNDPAYGLGNGYDPNSAIADDIANGKDKLGNIDSNTGSMADSMELAEEDLKFLRQIAEMEWRKEYTTASITVDMSNYNQINSESDLDGLVTKLSDKLYEELSIVANGVYA